MAQTPGVVLHATESAPPCRNPTAIFTLSATIQGTGNISLAPTDMGIQITGGGAGSTHKYTLDVVDGPLEFQLHNTTPWVTNKISWPPATVQTNFSPLFKARLKKTQRAIAGRYTITVEFRHGLHNPQCLHKVDLRVQVT